MGRPKKQAAASTHKLAVVEGATDIVTDTDQLWATVLKHFHKISGTYGFAKVETPLLEDAELYKLYFNESPDKLAELATVSVSDRPWTLRAELLPAMLRIYAQRKIYETQPYSKWMASGATMRLTPKGQLQAEQKFAFEVLGLFNHLTEAQVMGAVWQLLSGLGIAEKSVLEINHIGTSESQEAYESVLAEYLRGKKFDLCDSCTEYLNVRPLNVLRCAKVDCQSVVADAPTILDFLDEASNKHFTCILEALDEINIPYQLNPLYAGSYGMSRTNMIIRCKLGDKTFVIGEGGYHDTLLQRIGGKSNSAFGFSGSLSQIHKAVEASEAEILAEQKSEVFLVPLGELAARKSLRLFQDLTTAHVTVYDNFGTAGVKDQLKAAQTFKSPIALIMGQKEAIDEMVILRDVKSGMQEVFSYDKIVDEVKKRLGR